MSGRAAIVGVAAWLALGLAAAAHAAPLLAFVYVAANEGGSSGGHAGLRVDDTVFHYLQEPGRLLRLRREPAAELEGRYRLLENRPVRETRLVVDDRAARRLGDLVARRWVLQERQVAALDALEADRAFLHAVADARAGRTPPPVWIAGLGYFRAADGVPPPVGPPEPSLRRLRAMVEREGGATLDDRIDQARTRLRALSPPPPAPPPGERPRVPRHLGCAAAYENAVAELRALEVLRDATRLRPGTVREVGARLASAERRALATLRGRLEVRAAAMVGSPRPDRGFVLAVLMARLVAVDRSLAAGRWLVLDVLGPDPVIIPAARVERQRAALETIARERDRAVAAARAAIVATARTGGEADAALGDLERQAAERSEIRRALAERGALRVVPSVAVPAWPLRVDRPVLDWSDAALAAVLADVERAARAQRRALGRRYGYDLVRRNCVTAILALLDDALGTSLAAAPLAFVPRVAGATVERRLGGRTIELPSRRQEALARQARSGVGWLAAVREDLVPTATAYRRNPDDSVFLFFTDGAVLPRPVLGLANAVAALAATASGMALLPFDQGHLAWAGLRGALFSLPELAFVNIRKGTYAAPPARTSADDAPPMRP